MLGDMLLIAVDAEGRLVWANHRAREVLGWGGSEVEGRPCEQLLPPEWFGPVRASLAAGTSVHPEPPVVTRVGSGGVHWHYDLLPVGAGDVQVVALGHYLSDGAGVGLDPGEVQGLLADMERLDRMVLEGVGEEEQRHQALELLAELGRYQVVWLADMDEAGRPTNLGVVSRAGWEDHAEELTMGQPCWDLAAMSEDALDIHRMCKMCTGCPLGTGAPGDRGLVLPIRCGGEHRGVLAVRYRDEPEHQRRDEWLARHMSRLLGAGCVVQRSERALAEMAAELARRTQMQEALLEHSVAHMALLDRDFNFLAVNTSYARGVKIPREDLIGRNHFELFPSEAQSIFETVVQTGERFETRARPFSTETRPDLGVTYWDWALVPIKDDWGQVEMLVFSLHDVTDRIETEKALRRSEAEYRELVENANSTILRWTTDGTLTYVNDFGARFFGYRPEEMIGKNVMMLVPETDSEGRDLHDLTERIVASPPEYSTNENENITRDGRRVWMQWSNRVIRDHTGEVTGIMAIGTDRTERRRATLALERQQRMLRLAAASLDRAEEAERRRLATDLHDEVGQALALLKMKLGASKRKHEHPSDLFKELDVLLDRAIGYTRSLTLQLAPPLLEEVGLVPAVEWLADQVEEQHGLAVTVSTSGEPGRLAEADRMTVFRVVRELLMNVIKHAGAATACVRLGTEDDRLVVRVSDDGRGFDARAVLGAERQTAGFGLVSVQERLGYIGGDLQVWSVPGQGTTCTVTVPLEGTP